MRQLTYLGSGRLRVDAVDAPPLGPGEVRVAVDSVGICMSDVYGYGQVNDRRDVVLSGGQTLVMGHEPAGRIAELGAGVAGLRVGDAVAVDPIVGCGACPRCAAGTANLCPARGVIGCTPAAPGGFADAMVAPAAQLVAMDPAAPLELGALAEPLAVGHHGVCLSGLGPDGDALVIGGGIIGIGAALSARRRSSGDVLVLEPRPERRALCEALGVRSADPADRPGGGFDVALDCVARPETLVAAIDAVGEQGLVVLVGIWQDEIPLPVSTVVWRETRIAGSYGYTHVEFADVVRWLCRREVDLAPLIGRRVGFDDIIDTFDGYVDGSLTAVRTLLQPAL